MAHTRLTVKIAVLFGAAALLLAACGGSSSDTLSDEEFCAELEALEESDSAGDGDDLDAEALAQFRDLADRAPNEELSSALRTLGDIAEDMAGLDEDDPDAFGEVMALMFNPEVMAAGETIENYLVETCGYDETEFGGDFGDDDTSMSNGASAGTDLDTSTLNDELSDALDALDADYEGTGVTIFGGTVSFDVYGADDVDAVEVCERMADVVDDDDLDLEVFLDAELSAERSAGDACETA